MLSRRTRIAARLLCGAAFALAALTLLVACGGDEQTSPDLAFISTRDGDYAIYLMSRDGKGEHRLTDHDVDASSPAGLFYQVDPAWSPDGTKIVFSSRRSGSNDLYVVNADGTGARSIVASSAEESEPAWSPDGAWIAYVRRVPDTQVSELRLVRPDGSGGRQVTRPNSAVFTPAWSPDSDRIVFAGNKDGAVFELYTIGADGKGLRSVATTTADVFEPSWSPDGSRIAYSEDGAIFTVELGGGDVEQLTSNENNDSSPAWNPEAPPADD